MKHREGADIGPVRIGSVATVDPSPEGLRRAVTRAVLRALDPPAGLAHRDDLVTSLVRSDVDSGRSHARATLRGELAEFAADRGCRAIDVEIRATGSRHVVTCVLLRHGHDGRLAPDGHLPAEGVARGGLPGPTD